MELRQRLNTSGRGATLSQLVQYAESLDLIAHPVRIELEEVAQLPMPAILHWNFNHFVVLVKVSRNRALINDPAQGQRWVSMSELSTGFTGVAVQFRMSSSFSQKDERRSVRIRELLGHIPGLRATAFKAVLLALVLEMVAIVTPLFTQVVVDNAIVAGDRDFIKVLGVGFAVVMVFNVTVSAVRTWLSVYLGTCLNLQLISTVFRQLMRLPVVFFERRSLGDIVSRFDSTAAVQRTLTTSFIDGILDGLMSILTLAILFAYSRELGALVLAAVFIYWCLRFALFEPYRRASAEQLIKAAKQQSHFMETVRGIQSIKLYNRQAQRNAHWQNLVIDTFNASIHLQRLALPFQIGNGFLFGSLHIATIWVGALMVLDYEMTVGTLIAFVAYKQQFINRSDALVGRILEYRTLSLHRERLSDIALTAPEAPDPASPGNVDVSTIKIDVVDLGYRYSEHSPFIFRNVNFSILPGESLAIVGPSGCGKTTLLKLMLGILTPTEGEVLINGVSIHKFGITRYRQLLGTVMQEDQLFAGSIAQNISFFDSALDYDRVRTSALTAAILADIETMPLGFETLVGDMGSTLSGGQKQRVLLARAIYCNPKILYLDEATSHLDTETEHAVNTAVQEMRCTRLIIAHRASTIMSADAVFDLSRNACALPHVKRATAEA